MPAKQPSTSESGLRLARERARRVARCRYPRPTCEPWSRPPEHSDWVLHDHPDRSARGSRRFRFHDRRGAFRDACFATRACVNSHVLRRPSATCRRMVSRLARAGAPPISARLLVRQRGTQRRGSRRARARSVAQRAGRCEPALSRASVRSSPARVSCPAAVAHGRSACRSHGRRSAGFAASAQIAVSGADPAPARAVFHRDELRAGIGGRRPRSGTSGP